MNKDIKSLYIHIPFCENICDYCDFTKLQYFRIFAIKYLKSLKEEFAYREIPKKLETIYIGGGTPTALENDLFEDLLSFVSEYIDTVKEYTIEANPESLTIRKLQMMKKYGVNRISIGVESTNDNILKAINRRHTFKDVKSTVKKAKEIGFNNINVDLILGLPNITTDLLRKDIENVLDLNVQHISCYSLSVHPHTVFYNKGIKENDSDVEREYYDLVNSMLVKVGYTHYEVSNWCLPNRDSMHNRTYWKNDQYYGVGLGASGYIGNIRYTNTKNLDNYCKNQFEDYQEIVTNKDDIEYAIMLNMRMKSGINLSEFKKRYGYDLEQEKKQEIEELCKNGLIFYDKKCHFILPTEDGLMLLDQIILKII